MSDVGEHKLDPKGEKAIPLFIVHEKENNHSTIMTLPLLPQIFTLNDDWGEDAMHIIYPIIYMYL